MKRLKKINGFTLIELIITLSILGIVIVFMSQILNFNIRFVKHEDKRIEYAQNARIAANAIMDIVNMTDAANVNYTTNSSQIDIAGDIILDVTKQTTTPATLPRLWYYFPIGNQYGELMDNNGKVVAQYVSDLKITQAASGNYINVSISTGELSDTGNRSLNLSIPLKMLR